MGNSGEPREYALLGSEILSWVTLKVKTAKIVIYDQERVNGGSNNESAWFPISFKIKYNSNL